jgi:hypothetical protein
MDRWARFVVRSWAHYTTGRLASGMWHLISVVQEKLFTAYVRDILRIVAPAASCRPFMAKAPVRSQARPCKVYSKKVAVGQDFSV